MGGCEAKREEVKKWEIYKMICSTSKKLTVKAASIIYQENTTREAIWRMHDGVSPIEAGGKDEYNFSV